MTKGQFSVTNLQTAARLMGLNSSIVRERSARERSGDACGKVEIVHVRQNVMA
jgi:hypothetical protein